MKPITYMLVYFLCGIFAVLSAISYLLDSIFLKQSYCSQGLCFGHRLLLSCQKLLGDWLVLFLFLLSILVGSVVVLFVEI